MLLKKMKVRGGETAGGTPGFRMFFFVGWLQLVVSLFKCLLLGALFQSGQLKSCELRLGGFRHCAIVS